jgi:hypothetical protein
MIAEEAAGEYAGCCLTLLRIVEFLFFIEWFC